jgi:hypothetical protein
MTKNGILHAGPEVYTAVTMKNAVFWNVATSGSSKNRSFGGTYRLHTRVTKSVRPLLTDRVRISYRIYLLHL